LEPQPSVLLVGHSFRVRVCRPAAYDQRCVPGLVLKDNIYIYIRILAVSPAAQPYMLQKIFALLASLAEILSLILLKRMFNSFEEGIRILELRARDLIVHAENI